MQIKQEATSFAPTSELIDEVITEDLAERCVALLLRYIGEDPDRDGLKKTPRRVLKALKEMTAGYTEDPQSILATTFEVDVPSGQMIVLDSIQFTSLCEHHLLPFSGTAAVAYIPGTDVDRPVVGVSKLARLVECFARRLQVQERMTEQIADALYQGVKAAGTAVVVRAIHSCMSCRGVQQPQSLMVTSAMRGVLLTDRSARQEFLSYLERK